MIQYEEPDKNGKMRVITKTGDSTPIAKGKNILIPDNLQKKYQDLKNIQDYHKNKLKLRKKGILS